MERKILSWYELASKNIPYAEANWKNTEALWTDLSFEISQAVCLLLGFSTDFNHIKQIGLFMSRGTDTENNPCMVAPL